jgi:hypothetical protein
MIVIQEALLGHFLTYTYCTLVWFIPSIILPPSQLPFLKWCWQVSIFHIHTCSYSTIFTILYPPHWPSPSLSPPPLNMTCFTFLFFIDCLLFSGVLPWYFTGKYIVFFTILPLYYSSLPFLPTQYCLTVFCLVPSQMQCISILFISFFSSFFLP